MIWICYFCIGDCIRKFSNRKSYMKLALVIIAPAGFQDHELKGTRDGLMTGGFEVVLGSTIVGECTGKLGGKEVAEVALADVNIADYDRVAFIGGPGAHALWDDADALRIAREAVEAEKPLGAICIAPGILAKAGVLKGKRATIWNEDGGQRVVMQEAGATFTDESVTRDGLIVTANGPAAAGEFGRAFAAV